MLFQNNFLSTIEISAIFFTEEACLTISGCFFHNLTLFHSFLSISNTLNGNNMFIIIENSTFSNIRWNEKRPGDLILINGPFNNIQINQVFVFEIKFSEYLIRIVNSNSSIIIDSSIFQKNFVINYVLSIENASDVTISNFESISNNYDGNVFFSGGGNILLSNIAIKKISNLTVSLSFASQSAFGLTIIDKNFQESQNIVKIFIIKH